MVNGYLFDIDNFINSLRSQWINSHHTMEELHSIYIHLQQLITIHESMFVEKYIQILKCNSI
jgi:hypothetical protein